MTPFKRIGFYRDARGPHEGGKKAPRSIALLFALDPGTKSERLAGWVLEKTGKVTRLESEPESAPVE